MKSGIIITVSRSFGSGGREIAQKLASELNIPYYDNELIQRAAEKSGYSKEMFEQADLKPTGSLLYSMSLFATNGVGFDLPLSDKIFMVQSDVIKDVAKQGSCVIVGRCADYVLREYSKVVSFYVHADLNFCVDRAINKYKIEENRAKDVVVKNNKRRASYYNFYTNQKWGQSENYDLTIKSSSLGIDKCVEVLKSYVEQI